jgi:hypothetical protein
MVLNIKTMSVAGSADDIAALRADLGQLRRDMETDLADITLMLDDMRRNALPRGDDDWRLPLPLLLWIEHEAVEQAALLSILRAVEGRNTPVFCIRRYIRLHAVFR